MIYDIKLKMTRFNFSKLCIKALFVTLAINIILFSNAYATTRNVTCSGTITSSIQSAINSSVDGDIVNISAGNCSAGAVSWSNKSITIQGQGTGATTVNGFSPKVYTTEAGKASFRITGMSVGSGSFTVDGGYNKTANVKGWRIDHIAFSYPGCSQNVAIWVTGITWGLIDNSTFSGAGNAIFIRSWVEGSDEVNPWPPDGNPGMGGYSWALPLNQGSDEAVYVEDCTFTMPKGCYYGVGDMYFGGRMVFRYNTITNAYWQNHAARSYERGGNLNSEIYNNYFNATDSSWYRAIHIRSGTGVVFNNTISGYFNTMNVDNQRSDGGNTSSPYGACNGTKSWDGNLDGGWPCLDQIGRGAGVGVNNDQPSVPLYVWNNGSSSGCYTGGQCDNSIKMSNQTADSAVQSGRDYINNGSTPKPGYTPYPYPHPLRSGLNPPANLRIIN